MWWCFEYRHATAYVPALIFFRLFCASSSSPLESPQFSSIAARISFILSCDPDHKSFALHLNIQTHVSYEPMACRMPSYTSSLVHLTVHGCCSCTFSSNMRFNGTIETLSSVANNTTPWVEAVQVIVYRVQYTALHTIIPCTINTWPGSTDCP